MFWMGLTGGWETRQIFVPQEPDMLAVACYQTVEETATADCFYRPINPSDSALVVHVMLEPGDRTE